MELHSIMIETVMKCFEFGNVLVKFVCSEMMKSWECLELIEHNETTFIPPFEKIE